MPQTTTNQEPLPPPDQLFQLIKDKKSKFQSMPEGYQKKFLHYTFKFYMQPKLTKMGIQGKDLEEARTKFTARMMGQKPEPLSPDFGQAGREQPQESGTAAKIAGGLTGGAYAKLAGMVGHLADWDKKLDAMMQPKGNVKRDAIGRLIDVVGSQAKEDEAKFWDIAHEASPTAATIGAIGGDIGATGPMFGTAEKALQGVANPLLRHALSGAAGMAATKPFYSSDAQGIGKDALFGAVGGSILGPLADMLRNRSAAKAGGGMLSGVADKYKAARVARGGAAAVSSDLDALAQKHFKKAYGALTPDEEAQLIKLHGDEQRATQAATQAAEKEAKKSAKAAAKQAKAEATSTSPSGLAQDTEKKSKWRSEQHKQLKAAGYNPLGFKEQVAAGKSAAEIIAEQAGHKAKNAAARVGERAAATGIALQETPEVEKAVKGVAAVAPPKKEMLDKLDAAIDKRDSARSPLARAQAAKTVENVKKAIGGDAEAAKRVAKAETVAAGRAEAGAAQPSAAPSFEGGGKEGAGAPVATAPTEVPVVELVSGIKSIKTPNLDGAKMFKVVESSPLFKRMSDEEKRMTLEKVYQSVGAKLGIEGAEDMSLDELYVRITNAN